VRTESPRFQRRRPVPVAMARVNARRARGRFAILVLLLAAAVLARSAGSLVETGLEARTARAAAGTARPVTTVALVWWPGGDFSLADADEFLCRYLTGGMSGQAVVNYAEPIWAHADTVFGPTGYLTLVRVHPDTRDRESWRCWYESLRGRLPADSSEVMIPESLASQADLGLGDALTLALEPLPGQSPPGQSLADEAPPGQPLADEAPPDQPPLSGHQRTITVTVSGIYSPIGSGPAFGYILSVPEPGREDRFNMAGARDERTLGALRAWMTQAGTLDYPAGPPAAALPLVIGENEPAERAIGLARGIFGSQASSTIGLGFGLVGVAVLIILLVSVHERRREMATYKLVGMDNFAATQVLVAELGLAVGTAAIVAALAYGPLALHYLPQASSTVTAGALTVALIFLRSVAWTVVVTALAAAYPLAMASAATPMQLLTGQKVFLGAPGVDGLQQGLGKTVSKGVRLRGGEINPGG